MPSQCLLLVRHFLVNDINVEELGFACLLSLIAVNKYPTTWDRKDCSRSWFVKVLFTIALKAVGVYDLGCMSWQTRKWKRIMLVFPLFFFSSFSSQGELSSLNFSGLIDTKTSYRHTQTRLHCDYDSVKLTVKIRHCWLVQWFLVCFFLCVCVYEIFWLLSFVFLPVCPMVFHHMRAS